MATTKLSGTDSDKAGSRRNRLLDSSALLGLAVVGCAMALPPPASANPQGGTVVGGEAAIRTEPGRTTIDQASERAVINWDSFGIAPGETTRFNQPGRDAIALNRVTGAAASDIAGTLEANGNVWLVNPNGVMIRRGARIDVNGFLATTADIADRDFLAGRFDFAEPSPNAHATVVNEGEISISERGLAALVAPGVSNAGTITGQLGQVVLAGAPTFTVDFAGDGLINFDITSQVAQAPAGQAELVRNDGRIIAPGGSVRISASAAAGVVDEVINVAGLVEATAVTRRGGTIVLSGGDTGRVTVSGTLDASGAQAGQTGGRVEVLGDRVALADGARVDASGDAGGGTVLVGGAYQGNGPQPNATRTYVGAGAAIAADAMTQGDGGEVIVWADEATGFAGSISARGGAVGGDGGFVETSGKETLQVAASARVDTSALEGTTGQWLLDPTFIDVVGPGDHGGNLDNVNEFLDPDVTSGGTGIDVAAINAAASDVVLQAINKIDINVPIAFENTGVGLVAQAGDDIYVLADITTQGGRIHLEADSPHAPGTGADGTGDLVLPLGSGLVSNGGPITLIGAAFRNAESGGFSTIDAGSGAIAIAFSRDNASFQVGTDIFGPEFSAAVLDDLTTTGVLTLGQATTAGSDGLGTGAQQLTAGTLGIGTGIAPDVGALRLVSRGGIDQSLEATITVDELALSASGAVSLGKANRINTLAADAEGQALLFEDQDGLVIGSVAGVTGITADQAVLVAGGAIDQAAGALVTANELVLDAGGAVSLGELNRVGILAVSAPGQSVAFRNHGSFFIGSVGDFAGIEAGAVTIEEVLDPDETIPTSLHIDAAVNTTGDAIFQSGTDIHIDAPVTVTGDGRAVFQAAQWIDVDNDVQTQGGAIYLQADAPGLGESLGGDGFGSILLGNVTVSSDGGAITLIGTAISRGDDGFVNVDAGTGDIFIADSDVDDPFSVGDFLFSSEVFTISSEMLTNISTTGTLTLGQATSLDAETLKPGPGLLATNVEIHAPILRETGNLALVSGGGIDQGPEATIAVGGLALIAGGAITLDEPNGIGTLAVSAPEQSVIFHDRDALTIGTVAGVAGLDADSVDLIAGGDIGFLVDIGQDDPVGSLSLATEGGVNVDGRFRAGSLTLDIGGAFTNRNFGPSTLAGEGLDLGAFTILRAESVESFGRVAGKDGAAAALEPDVPAVDPDFTLNGCVIGSTAPCVAEPEEPAAGEPLDASLPRFTDIGDVVAGSLQLRLVPDQLLIPIPSQVSAGGEESLYANDGNEALW